MEYNHPNFVEIEASRRDLIIMLESRKQYWMGVVEMAQRQVERGLENILSCEKQLLDLEGGQLTLDKALFLYEGEVREE